jgi:class 3 adenylate cyclase
VSRNDLYCATKGDDVAMGEVPTGTVTMVFTDLEGSTALLARLGPGA